MFRLLPKTKPRIFEVRAQLCRLFVWLARRIDPKSDYVNAYVAEQLVKAQMDMMIYGQGCIEMRHKPFAEMMKDSQQEHKSGRESEL